jgi:hypothetical protein
MGMECVKPSKGLMYVRDKGHQPGGAKHGKPAHKHKRKQKPNS